ncbi:uncharacterized protein LOC112572585 isoform X2 [Pomacea canaliculata]|uniref:uncharacterized protein LOC112572585 isoform X2 n=1 Tax=Pomacea canaliculata TaxID=400727 RepID=UPI000D72A4A9|nr:uncharacterized protein LOC112572585 isoform X2 [Pomacea canaliculata]
MDPQDGGHCHGERLWLWLALLLTSASVAVTGSNCTCQGPVQGSCGYQRHDSRDNLYNTQSQRNVGVNVTVDGELCYIFTHPVSNPSTITCYQRLSGQVVRLSKTDYTTINDYYLTLCEVEVTGSNCTCHGHVHGSCDHRKDDFLASLSNTQNVALDKPTKVSSLLNSTQMKAVSGPACLAVNGDRNTTFTSCNMSPNSPSCIHTAEGDREPYWEVDLCNLYSIASITVYWRDSGSNCTCQDPVHGSCYHRRDDFRASLFNTQNVALCKPTKVSSLLNNELYKEVSGPACLAVNGDRNTEFRPCNQFPNNSSCIHTADDDREPYWEVDLCDLYSIANITVYWRDSNFQRNSVVKVTVDGKLCYIFDYIVSNPSTITCYQRLSGKTVRFSKTDYMTTDDYYLTLCEVEVMGKKTASLTN